MEVFPIKALAFIIVFLGLPIFISAHHSTNANFTQETISVEGVIERVRFQNPYGSVLIKNIDEQGSLFGCSSRELAPR